MSTLPRVSERTREKVSKEFDDLGPEATAAVVRFLEHGNPELLEMIAKCARDIGNPAKTLTGFAMFYRLLVVESSSVKGGMELNPLPRVVPETRDLLVKRIDELGAEAFAMDSIAHLEQSNPELLQMAHGFASREPDYLHIMQGFALIYQSLLLQCRADRVRLH